MMELKEIKGFRNEIEENGQKPRLRFLRFLPLVSKFHALLLWDAGRKTKSCKSDSDDMRIKVAECIKSKAQEYCSPVCPGFVFVQFHFDVALDF